MQEEDIKRLQLQCITKPGLMRDELDSIDTIIESQHPASKGYASSGEMLEHHSKFKKTCVCREFYRPSRSWPSRKYFHMTTKTLTSHYRGCPLFSRVWQSQTSVIVVKAMCTSFLMKAVEVSVSLTSGAGGFSIAPYLTLKTLCRDDSPAFRLFPEIHQFAFAHRRGLSSAYVAHMENSLRELTILFCEGKASSNDINSNGETILDVSEPHVLKPMFSVN